MKSNSDRKKPDFIVVGAMKCATSTVCSYLEAHPDVYMVPGCEPNFFSHDENYAKGPDWYAAFFENCGANLLCGEGSNDYVAGRMYPSSAARMARDLPDVKLIFMVRHPIARIVSAWVQNRVDSGDKFPPTLDDAVREMPQIYVDQSLYWQNLSRYREVFDDRQIFVGFMNDLSADSDAFWQDLCNFLEIAPVIAAKTIHANPSRGKRVPSMLYTTLNKASLVRSAKRFFPKRMRAFVKSNFLSHKAKVTPRFSPDIHKELAHQLRPDTQALLAHCNKPANFWNIS